MLNLNLIPGAIAELTISVVETHRLTLADRYGLMAAVLDDTLSEDERRSVDRLIRSLVRGKIQVVDELSMVM